MPPGLASGPRPHQAPSHSRPCPVSPSKPQDETTPPKSPRILAPAHLRRRPPPSPFAAFESASAAATPFPTALDRLRLDSSSDSHPLPPAALKHHSSLDRPQQLGADAKIALGLFNYIHRARAGPRDVQTNACSPSEGLPPRYPTSNLLRLQPRPSSSSRRRRDALRALSGFSQRESASDDLHHTETMQSDRHSRHVHSSLPGAFPETPPLGSMSPLSQESQADEAAADPDAFYRDRLYVSPPEPTRPTANTATGPPQTRLPPIVNGAGSKPAQNGLPGAPPTSGRTGSKPISQTQTNGVKARSGSSSAPRAVSSGSIKNRIREIEQASAASSKPGHAATQKPPRSRTPSSNGPNRKTSGEQPRADSSPRPAKANTLHKRPPSAQSSTARKVIPKPSPNAPKNLPAGSPANRQPLFGEVITVTNSGLGHGIPTNVAKRSASESNIQSPVIVDGQTGPGASSRSFDDSPFGRRDSPHSRSQSENTASPTPGQETKSAAFNDRSSKFKLPAATLGQNARPPASRSHAKAPRRYSASAEHLPSAHSRSQRLEVRPTTPAGKRYTRSPGRTPTSNHSINAVIKEMPGESPPPPHLRSSRPRVPVSAASTAASRARMQEKASAKGSRSASPSSKPSPSRERRPRTKGMLRSAEDARGKSRSQTRKANYAATDSSGSLSRSTSCDGSLRGREGLEVGRPSKPDIVVDTAVDPAHTELSSGFTEIDDDSPVLGRTIYEPVNGGQAHDRMANQPTSAVVYEPQVLSPIIASPDPNANPSPPEKENGAEPLSQDSTVGAEKPAPEGNLLQQLALRMRESAVTNGSGESRLTDLFGGADEGTINVAFRETPVLDTSAAAGWNGHDPPVLHFTSPNPEELSDSGNGNTPGSFDPDDSVSAILGPRSSASTTPSAPPPFSQRRQFTLDSEGREEINNILLFYNSHLISPGQKHEFQDQVAAITPALAQDEQSWNQNWAEPKATRLFLKRILDEDTQARRANEQAEKHDSLAESRPETPALQTKSQSARSTDMQYPYVGTPEGYDSPGTAFVQVGPLLPEKHEMSPDQFYNCASDPASYYSNNAGGRNTPRHQPLPFPKDARDGPLSGLGLEMPSPGFKSKLPEIEGAGEGLGLGIPPSPGRVMSPSPRSIPAKPTHAPPPPPPIPHSAADYSLSSPPSLPPPTSSPNAYRDTPLGSYQSPLQRSPETMRGKRRVNRGSDSSLNTKRLSIDTSSQRSGTPKHRRSFSSNTLAETIGARPSLEPERSINDSTTSTLADKSTSETAKRLTKRRYIIKELVDTEHAYSQDMNILEDIYKGTAQPILSKDDVKIVFGNLAQVRALSTKFLNATKKAAAPVYTLPIKPAPWNTKRASFSTSTRTVSENTEQAYSDKNEDERDALDRETCIGRVFREHIDELERIYGDYLKGQSAASVRLAELLKEPAVKTWLDECSDSANDLTLAWDLDSMLVKPLQRLTKYPLLIKQIKDSTEPDHPDFQELDLALVDMDRILQKINARTRREEVLQAVIRGNTSATKEKEKKKFPKLLQGKTSKMQQYVGAINVAEDKEYGAIAQRFGGHFFQLQIVMRDVEKYCEDVVAYVNWYINYITTLGDMLDLKPLGTNADLSLMESKWIAFGQAIKSIANSGLERHIREVRAHVIDPIVQLWRLHEQPQKMMQKRKKRLPEYAKFRDLTEKNQKADKRTQEAAEQFAAINDTLKEELPQLYTLTRKLIESCLCRFVALQTTWQESWMKQISRIDRSLEQQEQIESLLHDFRAHYECVQEEANRFSLINGEAKSRFNFLSPATTYSMDDSSSTKRPSTNNSRSVGSFTDQTSLNSPDPFVSHHHHRLSGSNMVTSPVGTMFPTPAELHQANRNRAASQVSSRGPSTPRSAQAPTPPVTATYPPRPATAAGSRGADPNVSRTSVEDQYHSNSRPRSGANFLSAEPGYYGSMPISPPPTSHSPGASGHNGHAAPSHYPHESSPHRLRDQPGNHQAELDMLQRVATRSQPKRPSQDFRGQSEFARDFYHASNASDGERGCDRSRSKVFSSAMPMDDGQAQPSPLEDYSELEVLFLAASLFEFRIDPNRMEAGYPYLRYAPGEVFDVVGIKGELWLARNQDDPSRTIGWIWEKHFARILDA